MKRERDASTAVRGNEKPIPNPGYTLRGVDDEDDEEREETSAPTQPTMKQREKKIQDGVTDGDNARQTCTGEG